MPHHADHTAAHVSDSLDNSILGDCPSHEWRVNLHRSEIMKAIHFYAPAIDRNTLPPIFHQANISTDGSEDPRGEFEQLLAKAWAEGLGIERIRRHNNFFNLGGHSLAALKIAFRIQQEFQVDFPLQIFVQHPVLSEQAKRLEEMVVEQADPAVLERLMDEMIKKK